MAEVNDVAAAAARFRARGGLDQGVLAVTGQQLGRVLKRQTINKNVIVQGKAPSVREKPAHSRGAVSIYRIFSLNAPFTRLAHSFGRCQGADMNRPTRKTPQAGGFILAASILIGALIGTNQGQPSAGIVIGAAIGLAIALFIWLRERR